MAALQKDDKPYARAVYQPKAFYGMHMAQNGCFLFHSLFLSENGSLSAKTRGGFVLHLLFCKNYSVVWQVLEITSICCSRVRSMNFTA